MISIAFVHRSFEKIIEPSPHHHAKLPISSYLRGCMAQIHDVRPSMDGWVNRWMSYLFLTVNQKIACNYGFCCIKSVLLYYMCIKRGHRSQQYPNSISEVARGMVGYRVELERMVSSSLDIVRTGKFL